jgi:hypothetical protein
MGISSRVPEARYSAHSWPGRDDEAENGGEVVIVEDFKKLGDGSLAAAVPEVERDLEQKVLTVGERAALLDIVAREGARTLAAPQVLEPTVGHVREEIVDGFGELPVGGEGHMVLLVVSKAFATRRSGGRGVLFHGVC